VLLPHEAK